MENKQKKQCLPSVRQLQAIPINHDGEVAIVLQDPQGHSPQQLVISQVELLIIQHFDGQHTVLDVQDIFMKQTGEILASETIEKIKQVLDDNYMLDNEKYRRLLIGLQTKYKSMDFRPLTAAGTSYPLEEDKLRESLNDLFKNGAGEIDEIGKTDEVKAIISPHIDYNRGGSIYTYAYKEFAENTQADTFVLLGIAHQSQHGGFIVTDKNFATPYGIVNTDQEFVDKLQEHTNFDIFYDELLHKQEHSLEFQAIMLKHVLGEKQFKIVPILCGHLQINPENYDLEDIDSVKNIVCAIKKTSDELGRKLCFIAGVDLAHVGLQFGDDAAPDEAYLKEIEKADLDSLKNIEDIDASNYFMDIINDRDSRKTCGFPAIYTLLKILPEFGAQKGKIIKYQQAFSEETGSCVTFAAASFS